MEAHQRLRFFQRDLPVMSEQFSGSAEDPLVIGRQTVEAVGHTARYPHVFSKNRSACALLVVVGPPILPVAERVVTGQKKRTRTLSDVDSRVRSSRFTGRDCPGERAAGTRMFQAVGGV